MAVVVGEAAVKLRPETTTFANEAERDIDDKLPGVARKAAGFFAAAFAAVGVGAFLGKAISEAVDLGESMSKVDVVFGESAGAIADFASTASTALGQSENQALAAAGTFGSLFVGMGIGQQQAAEMSTSMVTLASDMASFGNATPEEALDALRAGLIGEAEPLRRFGVMLDAAKIEAEAMRLGLVGSNGELTEAAKAQAVYSLAMAQTSLQQGDFQRTSEGLANQQRIMSAQFTDLSTDVGGLFVPALANAAMGITGGLMPALLRATDGLPAIATALGSIGDLWRVGFAEGPAAVNAATEGTDGLAFSIGQVAGTAGDLSAIFREAFVDGAAGSALLGDASLQGIAVTLGSVANDVVTKVGPAFGAIGDAVGPALGQVGEAFSGVFGGGGGGGGVLSIIVSALEVIGPIIGDYIARWLPVIEAIIPIIADVLSALAPIIGDLFAQIGPVLAALLPIISQVADVFASTLLVVIQALAPVLPVLVQAIGQIASALAGAFLAAIQAIAPVLPVIAAVIGQVAGMLAGALAVALQAIIPILPPIIEAFAQIALVLVGALMGALSAILPIIPTLVDALLGLVQAALIPLLPLLPILADLLLMVITALAPLIPPIVQVIALIIQLAVAAIVPLMPYIPILIGLFMTLVQAIMPIIGVVLNVVGAFIGMAATVASVVIGFVSTVIGVFTGFWTGVTGIVTRIVGGVTGGFQGLKDGVVRIFSGIADFVGGMFEGIGGGIKGAINAVIRGINNTVIDGINVVIRGVNAVNPFDDIPNVPKIPTFHLGGVFTTDNASGEGLALLRDDELIATPEQRRVADNLLRSLLAGDLALPTAAATSAGTPQVVIEQQITQQPGESAASLAARVTQGVVWNLNAGITRPVGAVASS